MASTGEAAGEGQVEMKQLMVMKGTQCFLVEGTTRKLLGTTDLQVLALGEDSLMLYSADCFHYATKKGIISLRAGSHSFVFPGANHQCFGIVLPKGISEDDMNMFVALLAEFSDYSVQVDDDSVAADGSAAAAAGTVAVVAAAGTVAVAAESEDKVASVGMKAAGFLKKGTALASAGIAKGTIVAASGIRKAKEYAKRKITKRKEVEVSETTRARIKKAKTGTRVAVKVSAAIVVGAKSMLSELSHAVADAAAGTSVGKKIRSEESERVTAAKEVGKATIIGVLTIVEELSQAAVILVGEVADAGADVSEYKYGTQVGEAAADAADIVKSTAMIAKHVTELQPGRMVLTTAADATVEVLSTEEEAAKYKAAREGDSALDPEVKALAFVASTAMASKAAEDP